MVSTSNIPKYLKVSFSPRVLISSWFVMSVTSVMCRFMLLISSMVHFTMSNSIPMYWQCILTACIRAFNSFSLLTKSLMSSLHIRWLIFSCDLWSLYPPMRFLNMWFSSIIAITNRTGDRSSPRKISHWIFSSAKLFPPAVNTALHFSKFFSSFPVFLDNH